MQTATKWTRIGILVLAICQAGAAGAQPSDPPWLDLLNEHARLIEQCEIDYIVRFHESELGGRKFYEARIKCADGRMFDASRMGPAGFFEFKACEVKVC